MSIKVNTVEPCAKNLSKLLKAIAEYIDHNQKIECMLELTFINEKKKS